MKNKFLLTLFEYLDENLCAEAFKFIQPHLMNDEHFLFKMIQFITCMKIKPIGSK